MGEAAPDFVKRPRRPSHLGRIVKAVLSERRALLFLGGTALLVNLCSLAAPRLTQAILDRVLPAGDQALLTQLAGMLTLVTAVQIVLTIARRLQLVQLSLTIDRHALQAFCAHLWSLPLDFFTKHRAGDLAARFTDHGHVRHFVLGAGLRGASDAVMVGVYVVVLFCYHKQLAAVVAGLLALTAAATLLAGPILQAAHRRLQDDKGRQEAELIECLQAIELVKALSLEDPVQSRWQEGFVRYTVSNYQTQRLRQLLESMGTALQFLSTLALFWFGARLVLQGQLSIGALAAFVLYASLTLPPMLSLVLLWDEWQQAKAALTRLHEVLDAEPETVTASSDTPCPLPLQGRVQFDHVTFRYPERAEPALTDICFTWEPGECLALVGPSGSGKTTLARLVLGLCRPTSGRIRIDGLDLRSLSLRDYRGQLGVVLQENLLLSGTVAENIALTSSAMDQGRVETAIRQAGAAEFVDALPEGLSTRVGERGHTLSMGQRQRLALARALYRRPRLLIVDEITSALDAHSAQHVLQTLRDVNASGVGVLLITHQPEALAIAQRILVLAAGQLRTEGPPGLG